DCRIAHGDLALVGRVSPPCVNTYSDVDGRCDRVGGFFERPALVPACLTDNTDLIEFPRNFAFLRRPAVSIERERYSAGSFADGRQTLECADATTSPLGRPAGRGAKRRAFPGALPRRPRRGRVRRVNATTRPDGVGRVPPRAAQRA